MATFIDLSDIPVIDNHCHAVVATQGADPVEWLQRFTESPDPAMGAEHVRHTVFYRRLMRRIAARYGLRVNDEAGVLAYRAQRGSAALVGELFPEARIGGVVIDTGYPSPALAMRPADFVAASGAEYAALMRLEVEFQRLIVLHADYNELLDAVRQLVSDVRAKGFCGFKSIVAYRTGLSIAQWDTATAMTAFQQARHEVQVSGVVRLGYKALLDTLLHIAFEAAAEQELPVQFHVGYGDPDVDLRASSPLELRSLFENPRYRAMSIVMLHGCWPYFREGAYLAAVYGNAFLDISYAIPFLSRAEMTSMTRSAFGVAPLSKIMYSSDAVSIPEMHWIGALDGRQVIGTVLGELVDDHDLEAHEARQDGRLILNATAARLYGLTETAA